MPHYVTMRTIEECIATEDLTKNKSININELYIMD